MNFSGTICRLKKPEGENYGRLVRVLLPILPGEEYGEGRVFSASKDPSRTYYLITSLDGKPMRGKTMQGVKFTAPTVVAGEEAFELVQKAGEDHDEKAT